MQRLSFTAKRVLSGIATAQALFFVMNFYWFHLFGEYDKKALVLSSFLLGICVLRVGPTVEELREYRAKQRNSKS
jgi:hypothetical protein